MRTATSSLQYRIKPTTNQVRIVFQLVWGFFGRDAPGLKYYWGICFERGNKVNCRYTRKGRTSRSGLICKFELVKLQASLPKYVQTVFLSSEFCFNTGNPLKIRIYPPTIGGQSK